MMANLPLAFAELLAGGLLAVAGATGESIENVIAGNLTLKPFAGAGSPGSLPAPADTTSPAGAPTGNVGQVTDSMLQSIAAAKGWTSQQIAAWKLVINRESGGDPKIVNSSSGAAGIAQFINGWGEYAQYGGDAGTVQGQLTAMANYITQRYGNPSNAWAHEQGFGWY